MEAFIENIHQFIKKYQLLRPSSTIIVGLSGGPDSVFLLYFLVNVAKEYDLSLIVAHLDHGWRASSPEDAIFCKAYAKKLGIPCVIAHLREYQDKVVSRGSCEDEARQARRFFFEEVARTHDASCIALAHHADDQEETFFIRLLRGASLSGLGGMRPQSGLYIRPLLTTYKKDILAFLKHQNIAYCVDETNESDAFLRNRIRRYLIPALRLCDQRASKKIASTVSHLQAADDALSQVMSNVYNAIVDPKTSGLHMAQFLAYPQEFQCRMLEYWFQTAKISYISSQALFEEITRFMRNNRSNKHCINPGWSLEKEGNFIRICQK